VSTSLDYPRYIGAPAHCLFVYTIWWFVRCAERPSAHRPCLCCCAVHTDRHREGAHSHFQHRLLQELQGHGALARHHVGVVVGVHGHLSLRSPSPRHHHPVSQSALRGSTQMEGPTGSARKAALAPPPLQPVPRRLSLRALPCYCPSRSVARHTLQWPSFCKLVCSAAPRRAPAFHRSWRLVQRPCRGSQTTA
jgi:hypothetical protein